MTAGWRFTSPIAADPIYDKTGYSSRSNRTGYKHQNRASPIPADPVYSNDCDHRKDVAPKPRIKPEAMNIARLHQGGALAQLFNPNFRIIPVGTRPSKYHHCACHVYQSAFYVKSMLDIMPRSNRKNM